MDESRLMQFVIVVTTLLIVFGIAVVLAVCGELWRMRSGRLWPRQLREADMPIALGPEMGPPRDDGAATRGAAMNGRPWTEAERDRLLALKAGGLGNVAIARLLGRSATGVGTQLYALRHPDRAAATQAAYRERQGDRVRERQAERYRADRPRLVAAHRDYYATNRDRGGAPRADWAR
jgi:hypothetical protein